MVRATIRLAQLHGCERHGGEHRANQPETHDHLGFGPALALEMVMDGGHEEDAFALAVADARVLEVIALDDDGEGFCDEDAADEDEGEFVANDDGDVADQTTE